MKVLITSGGTKVPIDAVRSITNMSQGTFGSKIGVEFLQQNHEVMFLASKNSCKPFTLKLDFRQKSKNTLFQEVLAHFSQVKINEHNYAESEYDTFDSYAIKLKEELAKNPQIVVLAAAVSDYVVSNPVTGKIRSANDMLVTLTKAEKLIGQVKKICPSTTLVGFKLLVDATFEDLQKASMESIAKNGCDMIVANDYLDLKRGNHVVHFFYPDGSFYTAKTGQVEELVRRSVELRKAKDA